MQQTKIRRTRTAHAGVKLRCRTWDSGIETWFARWKDPDTGRETDTNLTALRLTTHEARREWAIRKSKALAQRRADIATGAPRKSSTPFSEAVTEYIAYCKARLRDTTANAYAVSLSKFTAWAERVGITLTESITPPKLTQFRDTLLTTPRERGAGPISGHTLNHTLRAVKTLLIYWRERGRLPNANREEIGAALKRAPSDRPRPNYLKAEEIRALLQACQRHDGEKWSMTRAEKFAGGETNKELNGHTPRYAPITPFVAFLLLTGCRIGEALKLQWRDVNLSARDENGREVGEIELQPTATKTHDGRVIDLAVSPRLRAMLAALKLQRRPGDDYVFGGPGPLPRSTVEAARRRLFGVYGAPRFDWQQLRQTCGSFLTNAYGIFGAAAAFRSARQLGHSVAVAERHYLGVVRSIPRDAHTLDDAMQIADFLPDSSINAKDFNLENANAG